MARPYTLLLSILLLSLSLLLVTPASACRRCSRARAFLEASCRPTRYPQLCVKTLITSINPENLHQYRNPRTLAQVALTACLTRAHRAQDYITKIALNLKGAKGMEYQAVNNCLDQIKNSMDQISQSIRELGRINDKGSVDDFMWHSDNVVTWTSAALTDQSSCLYTFPGGKRGRRVQAEVRAQLSDVAQSTSNALALVNRFVVRHRLGRGSIGTTP